MFKRNKRIHETTTEARGAVNVKGMTTVLLAGLALVIIAFVIVYLTR